MREAVINELTPGDLFTFCPFSHPPERVRMCLWAIHMGEEPFRYVKFASVAMSQSFFIDRRCWRIDAKVFVLR